MKLQNIFLILILTFRLEAEIVEIGDTGWVIEVDHSVWEYKTNSKGLRGFWCEKKEMAGVVVFQKWDRATKGVFDYDKALSSAKNLILGDIKVDRISVYGIENDVSEIGYFKRGKKVIKYLTHIMIEGWVLVAFVDFEDPDNMDKKKKLSDTALNFLRAIKTPQQTQQPGTKDLESSHRDLE